MTDGSPPPAPLIVLTGPPGAGKSTVAAVLADRFARGALVAGDDFFAFLARGAVPPWLPEARGQNETVLRAAAAAAGRLAAGGIAVVYDGVIDPRHWAGFTAATGLPTVAYAVLLPPVDVCLSRVAGRTGHGFTDEAAARHMHDSFVTAEVPAGHLVHTAGAGPSTTADLVLARFHDGRLGHAA